MHYDVAIIGCGPAGASVALGLKDSGLSVVMLDKATFPRDKICGDAVGGRAKKILNQYFDGSLELLEKNDSFGWKLFAPNGKIVEATFVNSGYLVPRIQFDEWLYKDLNSVNKLDNYPVKEIKVTDEHVVINNDITATIIIGCDGAHSIVAKQLANFKVDHRHYSGAVRAYFRNVSDVSKNHLEIHLVKDHLPGYFWIFPLKNNICNVGFGMLSSDISERKINLKSALQQIIKNLKRFDHGEQLGDIEGFGLPLGGKRRGISGERFMLCGDAASLIDPLTGEGIGNAMLSGKLAAEQILHCFKNNDFSASTIQNYDRVVYKKLLPELRKNLLIQRVMNREWLINGLVNFAIKNPGLKDRIARYL